MIRATNDQFHCIDCDEVILQRDLVGRSKICLTCGAALIKMPSPVDPDRDDRPESLNDLFELLGADLRDSLMDAMSQSRPSRQISVSYLKTLGKVTIDDQKTILRDISLRIGPLHMLAVSAQFGCLPEADCTYEHPIVCGMPVCAETALTNSAKCAGSMVLLDRGVVSFASKCLKAVEAGAAAVIIAQTAGVWPFVMADSAKELETRGVQLSIPVVMISQKDSELVRKFIAEQDRNTTPVPPVTNTAISATISNVPCVHKKFDPVLQFGPCVVECSICQEDFVPGGEVLKLPCRHVYHTDCVTNWLVANNTCPLCRLELPKETEGRKLPNNAPVVPVDPSRMYYN